MQPRPLPRDMLEEAMKQSKEMIDNGQIVMGASSYNSNILMVPKPMLRGQTRPSLRLVIDYRALNSRTIKLNWPLLPTMEALDYMSGYGHYCASDCASGYHQIKVCPSIAKCLAYSVGTWRLIPLKMPMGATNSMNCFMFALSRAIGHLAQGCCSLNERNQHLKDEARKQKDAEQHCSSHPETTTHQEDEQNTREVFAETHTQQKRVHWEKSANLPYPVDIHFNVQEHPEMWDECEGIPLEDTQVLH